MLDLSKKRKKEEAMARVNMVGGDVDSWIGVYANCPNLLRGLMFNNGLLWSHSKLDPVLKDLIRLKSSNLNGCLY
jgi:alkylhydroperoxidase family enzyme